MRRRIYQGTGEADVIRASRHADFLFGRAGDDRLFGRDGDDALFGGAGNDRLDGGAGFDTADFRGAITGVNADLTTGVASDGQGGTDRLISVEGLTGSRFEDTLVGDAGANTLSSGGGGDLLRGMGGDDLLRGGEGADTFDGGDGFDTADYSHVLGAVKVDLSVGFGFETAMYDRYYGVEGVIGSRFDDVLIGWRDDNALAGGDGQDILAPGAGSDLVDGGAGFDYVDYRTSAVAVTVDLTLGYAFERVDDSVRDTLVGIEGVYGSAFEDGMRAGDGPVHFVGGGGFDDLVGGAADDILEGGDGSDELTGGAGDDTFYGGRGSDTFHFTDALDVGDTPDGTDMIVDFSQAELDRINLSRIDADVTTEGKQGFTFIGDSGFTGTAGELRYAFVENDQTVLMADVDGDGLADGYIRFAGTIAFAASDFSPW